MEKGNFAQSRPPYPKMSFPERRKSPRFECDFPIDCITTESDIHVGIAANISQGGILICLHDRIKVGTPLRIHLVFNQGFQLKSITANAVVLWRNLGHHAFRGRYRYGLRLIEMSDSVFSDYKVLLGQLAREFHLKNPFPTN
jgi:c-di-GMP-binding flagellar brake protein YcgR